MKAILYSKYGGPEVLQLKEIERPVPKDNEVLIRIHATSVTAADTLMRRGDSLVSRLFLGLTKPRRSILGTELAGEIETIGRAVTRYKKGDQVYGFAGFGLGTYAQYKCMPEKGSLVLKPENLSYEEAASVCDGASTAWFFLNDKIQIRQGQKVLINGASGNIGTFAVQLAKYIGAEVTGVCSTAKLDFVKSLGADRVIDYTKEDFTRNAESYDIIFDTVGKRSFSQCKGSLKPQGCYLTTVGGLTAYARMLWTRISGGKRIIVGMSIDKTEALTCIKELIEAGKLKTAIDRSYPLEHMAEAHRYVEQGHKKGGVVITL